MECLPVTCSAVSAFYSQAVETRKSFGSLCTVKKNEGKTERDRRKETDWTSIYHSQVCLKINLFLNECSDITDL